MSIDSVSVGKVGKSGGQLVRYVMRDSVGEKQRGDFIFNINMLIFYMLREVCILLIVHALTYQLTYSPTHLL